MIGASLHVRSSRQTSRPAPSGSRRSSIDRVGRVQRRRGQRLRGGRRRLDLVARAAQVRRERAQELRLVVDDEDARLHDADPAGKRAAGQREAGARAAAARGSSSSVAPFDAAKPRAIARPRPSAGLHPRAALVEHLDHDRAAVACAHRPRPSAIENLSALSITFTSTRWICAASTRRAAGRRASSTRTRSGAATSATAWASSSSTGQSAGCGAAAPACEPREIEHVLDEPDQPRHLEPRSCRAGRRGRRASGEVGRSEARRPRRAIVASGVRKSWETLCRMTVLIASERRTASSARAPRRSASSDVDAGLEARAARPARRRRAPRRPARGSRRAAASAEHGRGVREQRRFALALLRLGRAPARARRELARDDRRDQVHGERRPVACVGERQRVHRRQEEEVERQHRRDGDGDRVARRRRATAAASTASM